MNGQPPESNRYDGAPAPKKPQPAMPSKAEVEADRRRYLRTNGCARCDETDPDELTEYAPLVAAVSCKARQSPGPGNMVILCDECEAARPSYRESRVESAREKGADVVVFYECNATETAVIDIPDDAHPATPPNATLQALCRCGAEIDEIRYLGGEEDGD